MTMQTNQVIEKIKEILCFLFIVLVGYLSLVVGSVLQNAPM